MTALLTPRLTILAARQRRLGAALHDLGITEAVGPYWATVYEDCTSFETLAPNPAERFLRLMEGLVEHDSNGFHRRYPAS